MADTSQIIIVIPDLETLHSTLYIYIYTVHVYIYIYSPCIYIYTYTYFGPFGYYNLFDQGLVLDPRTGGHSCCWDVATTLTFSLLGV